MGSQNLKNSRQSSPHPRLASTGSPVLGLMLALVMATSVVSCFNFTARPEERPSTLQSPERPSTPNPDESQCHGPSPLALEPEYLRAPRWIHRNLPILFGTEFEFPTVYGMSSENDRIPTKYTEYVRQMCQTCGDFFTCTVKKEGSGERIQVFERASRLSLEISPTADQAVLELRTGPMTYEEYRQRSTLLQVFVFHVTARMERDGILISSLAEPNRWSGHINVSWPGMVWAGSTKNPQIRHEMTKILRFYADYQNFPELAMGVLGGDIRNGPPLALFPQRNITELNSILQTFETSKETEVWEILTDMQLNQYAGNFKSLRIIDGPRFSAINLFPLVEPGLKNEERRMELRAFYTPQNLAQFLSQYRIVQSRLGYVFGLRGEIPPIDRKLDHPKTFKTRGLQEGVSLEQAAKSFIIYLYQAGLDPRVEATYLTEESLKNEVVRIWREQCLLQSRQR